MISQLSFMAQARHLHSMPYFAEEGSIMGWAEEEFAGADLGDERLNRQLVQLP